MAKCNEVKIRGEILDNPRFESEYKGKRYYRTKISLKRFSGVNDIIPLRISEKFLEAAQKGNFVEVRGVFNSASVFGEDRKQHLKLFVFANTLEICNDDTNLNEIYLKGIISKCSEKRSTPLGALITDIMIVTKRGNGITDCIPCIAWNAVAEYAEKLKVGTEIEIFGRLQSREYTKKLSCSEEKRVAYEVSVRFLNRVL